MAIRPLARVGWLYCGGTTKLLTNIVAGDMESKPIVENGVSIRNLAGDKRKKRFMVKAPQADVVVIDRHASPP